MIDLNELFALATGQSKRPIAIGRLNGATKQALRSHSYVVFLSYESLCKQLSRHKDIRLEHYAFLPYILTDGELLICGSERKVHLILDASPTIGHRVAIVVKVDRRGNKLFVTSFHRLRDRDLRRLRKRAARFRKAA